MKIHREEITLYCTVVIIPPVHTEMVYLLRVIQLY